MQRTSQIEDEGSFQSARFFDRTDQLVDDKGTLKAEYSWDGRDLNIQGYLAVEQKIRALLARR